MADQVWSAGKSLIGKGIPTRVVVMALGVVIVVIGVIYSAMTFVVSQNYQVAGRSSSALMHSMREHMTADMLHDGLRGVVFRAAYAGVVGDAELVEEAADEIAEYGGDMRAAVAAQHELELPPHVIAAVEGVAAPLDAYLASAESLVQLVASGDIDGAQAALPGFNDAFKALEDRMSEVSDAIEAANANLLNQSAATAQWGDIAALVGLAMIVLLAVVTLILSNILFLRPLAGMTDGFKRLTAGNLEIETRRGGIITEMAMLADVLADFRATLVSRAELSAQTEATTAEERQRQARGDALTTHLTECTGRRCAAISRAAYPPISAMRASMALRGCSTDYSTPSSGGSTKPARCSMRSPIPI